MPIHNLWFNHKLESIRVFLSRAISVDDEYVRAFNRGYTGDWSEDAETDHAGDILLSYQDIVIRATINELNSLVEHELKLLAKSILEQQRVQIPDRMSRGDASQVIERDSGVSLGDLPRFAEVDELRRVINAYKHDDGYSGQYRQFLGNFDVEEKYELDWDRVMEYVEATRDFLLALPGNRESIPEMRLVERSAT